MANYATMRMEDILNRYYSLRPGDWRTAAGVWEAMATRITGAQKGLDDAWNNTPVFRLNEHDPEAKAFQPFESNIDLSRTSANDWSLFAARIGERLKRTAEVIEGNKGFVDAAAQDWHRATEEDDKERARQRAALYVWNVANQIRDTFNGIGVPPRGYQGPLGSRPNENTPGGGDPNAQGGGAGAGTGGPGDLGAGDKPGDSPAAAPKGPEAKDPLDQASKLVKLAGDGIDLLGKPADVAGKYVGLAQSLKDLLGGSGTGTEGLELPSADSAIPDYTDQPTLAGGAGTAPTFDPGTLTGGGSAGGGGLPSTSPVAGLGAVGAAGSLGATGSVGAAPSLAGKGTSTSAAGAQQPGMPMYPPMGGMGAGAGGGGRGDIKPGTAAPRAGGFSLPAEQSESERWRRHGVQADLQGRTGDEHRSASVAPALRKRKGSARTAGPAEQDVLDEELWRL
jgi:hypothetical protein